MNADRIGVGLGLYNLTNFIGMALGPALASKLLELGANYSFLFLGAVFSGFTPVSLTLQTSTPRSQFIAARLICSSFLNFISYTQKRPAGFASYWAFLIL